MSDFLTNIAATTLNVQATVQPRLVGWFEPLPPVFGPRVTNDATPEPAEYVPAPQGSWPAETVGTRAVPDRGGEAPVIPRQAAGPPPYSGRDAQAAVPQPVAMSPASGAALRHPQLIAPEPVYQPPHPVSGLAQARSAQTTATTPARTETVSMDIVSQPAVQQRHSPPVSPPAARAPHSIIEPSRPHEELPSVHHQRQPAVPPVREIAAPRLASAALPGFLPQVSGPARPEATGQRATPAFGPMPQSAASEEGSRLEDTTVISGQHSARPALQQSVESDPRRLPRSLTPQFPAVPPLMTPGSPTSPEPAPVIRVTIGRIEVRASVPPAPQPRPRSGRRQPALSLDAYLQRRNGG